MASTETLPALYTTGTFPPLAVHNHRIRMEAVLGKLTANDIKSIVDIGCGDGAFLDLLLDRGFDGPILGVDTSQDRLDILEEKHASRVAKGLLKLVCGSMTSLEDVIEKPERSDGLAVIMIESIEHTPVDTLPQVANGVFGHIQPALAVITTPDATHRLSQEKLDARGHEFEWDPDELAFWAVTTACRYGYRAEAEQITGPTFVRNTQIATFVSK